MIITRDEVKNILKIQNTIIDKEETTIDTCNYKRLAHKPVINIYRVDTDTQWSTASAYTTADYYTTEDYSGYTLFRRIDTGTINTTEVVYVSYSYSDYDNLIDYLIPIVQADLITYLNNDFADTQTRYQGGSFRFIERDGSSQPRITDTVNSRFLYYGFDDDMDISVKNTNRNEGVYTISSAVADIIKLSDNDSLVKEHSTDPYCGHNITIDRIKWPIEIKPLVAYIIWSNISRAKDQGITSKSLGPSSISYESLQGGGYAPSIYEGLRKFKNARMI